MRLLLFMPPPPLRRGAMAASKVLRGNTAQASAMGVCIAIQSSSSQGACRSKHRSCRLLAMTSTLLLRKVSFVRKDMKGHAAS